MVLACAMVDVWRSWLWEETRHLQLVFAIVLCLDL